MTSGTMSRAYDPAAVERRIYGRWQDGGYFHAVAQAGRAPYTIIMPPPNVTGELHLGHALEKALEDALIRYRRMTGAPTLWLPGTDHAGIATQWVVERQLLDEATSPARNRTRGFCAARLGTRGKIRRHHSRAVAAAGHLRRLAAPSSSPSTPAPATGRPHHLCAAVSERADLPPFERIINRCTRCATALSDLEVDYQEVDGKLYYIRYPLEDAAGFGLCDRSHHPPGNDAWAIAAVAVHPDDPRYDGIRGRNVSAADYGARHSGSGAMRPSTRSSAPGR